MIELKNLSKSFGEKQAVKNLSFNLKPGSIVGFIGPNGAGKTTTMRMLSGIIAPDEGTAIVNGFDIQEEPLDAKKEFAFIADNPNAFLTLTGNEYINFMCNIYDVPKDVRPARLQELAEEMEMSDELSNRIETYSHGMRQKIHIIAALMHNPNFWIMDEPMTGLDPQASYLLKRRMRKHADAGNVVFFSTHVLEVAEKLCDQILIINKGELYYSGTLPELKVMYPDLSLEEIFLTVTESKVLGQS